MSSSAVPAAALGGRRAYLVWGAGVLAYVVAVFHRSSLGVAGIEASERFGIGASTLALFTMVQLVVYAGMQVPAGVLLDRFGSRRLLVAGAACMAVGQVLFAVAASVPVALTARVLLGLGDALTFISVLRLVVMWFPSRRNPLLVQLTGVLGQLGAVAAALPLLAVIRAAGWTAAFVLAAAVAVAVVVLLTLVLRDGPYDVTDRRTRTSPPVPPPDPASAAPPPAPRPSLEEVLRALRGAWAEPGTRLGLWTHFVTQFSGTVFLLLWGFPFLVSGLGLRDATAGGLLTLLTVATVGWGPVVGALIGRHPFHRSQLVVAIVGATAAAWTLVLLWPSPVPLPVLVVLVVVLAVGGPGALIGFDYARSFNPAGRVGSASGIVNVGGFAASLVTVGLIGAVLDLATPGSAGASTGYSPEAFRLAMSVQYAVWALGLVQVLRYRRIARRQLATADPEAFAALRRGVVLPAGR